VRGTLTSGAGLEKWRQIVRRRAEIPASWTTTSGCPSLEAHLISATRAGYLAMLDAELIGRATVLLGAGRNGSTTRWTGGRRDDSSPAGAMVEAGDPLVG